MNSGHLRRVGPGAILICLIALPALCGCASGPPRNLRGEDTGTSMPTSPPEPERCPARLVPPGPPVPAGSAVVAIVIDDCGESPEQVVPFLGIPVPLSFGVLPWHSESMNTSLLISARGFETLAHMPMEPHDPRWLENDWFLTTGMDREQIRIRIDRALDGVPCATGMNNHMGSRFTADAPGMDHVMSRLKERGIYFLDSRTSDQSAAIAACSRQDARCLSRDVFIDNEDDVEAITAQIKRLVEAARKNGCAIGIGHCRSKTAAAIMHYVRARDPGVVFVPAGRIFEHCPSGQPQNLPE